MNRRGFLGALEWPGLPADEQQARYAALPYMEHVAFKAKYGSLR